MARQLLDVFRETGRIELFLSTGRSEGEAVSEFMDRLRGQFGDGCFSEVLFYLTHMSFSAEAAHTHWQEILGHRERLEGQTGRKVSLQAAVIDYFTSVQPRFDSPVTLESSALARCARLTLMDELTGLFNRRFFNVELEREMDRSRRLDRSMSLFMVDIDHFKAFNDTYGHASGDRVLAGVARVLREEARITDQPARYGGEEFAVILPHTDKANALVVAERYRSTVEEMTVRDAAGTPLPGVTISLGVAQYPDDAGRPASMVNAADRALYRAKHQGRNQVCTNSAEDREAPRLAMALDGEALVRSYSEPPFRLRTLNVSVKGACCELPAALKPGTALDLVLRDPRREFTLPLSAHTVWTTPAANGRHHGGIAFDQPDGHALEQYFDALGGSY